MRSIKKKPRMKKLRTWVPGGMLKKFAKHGRGCKGQTDSHSFHAKYACQACGDPAERKGHRASIQAEDSTERTAMERGKSEVHLSN